MNLLPIEVARRAGQFEPLTRLSWAISACLRHNRKATRARYYRCRFRTRESLGQDFCQVSTPQVPLLPERINGEETKHRFFNRLVVHNKVIKPEQFK
jgi:hypothetical protein